MRPEDPRVKFAVVLAGLLSVTLGLHYGGYLGPLVQLFSDPQYLRETATAYQELGVPVLLGLQVLNNILAPVPGQGIGVAYGLMYGPIWGTLFGMIGTTIGTTIAVLVSKRYGQPVVTSLIGEKRFEKYNRLVESADVWPFVILIVLPVIPDDAIAYIGGLSTLSTRRLIFWLSLARLPGMLALAWFGDGIATGDYVVLGGLTVVVTAVSLWVIWKREWIMERLSTPSPDR